MIVVAIVQQPLAVRNAANCRRAAHRTGTTGVMIATLRHRPSGTRAAMLVPAAHPPAPAAAVNLWWLFILRNVAIAGQVLALAVAVYGLHLALPVLPLVIVIGSLAMINVFTRLRLRHSPYVSHREFFFQLSMDVMALTALLYFTGGATNPFCWLFLLPLTIAASVLRPAYTWAMAAFTTACYTWLTWTYVPFPYPDMHHGGGFHLHVMGMWIGFVLSAGVVAYFVTTMAAALRARDRSLAAAREQTLRDERVIALGTLAAGAAHELGTPLGTIAVLAEELEEECAAKVNPDFSGRLNLLRAQVDRCKEAISVLSQAAGEPRAEAGGLMPVDKYLEDLMARWHLARPGVLVHTRLGGSQPAPRILAERTLTHALMSLLDNAADASPEAVDLDGRWSPQELVIEVCDRGGGLSREAAAHAGREIFTTKADGLGVGLLLAHTAVRRFGGEISLANGEHGGTRAHVVLPLPAASAGIAP